MKIKVPVKVVTIVNKDTGKTKSIIGNDDITVDGFEGRIFGQYFNVSGLWKAIKILEEKGHKVIETSTKVEIEI